LIFILRKIFLITEVILEPLELMIKTTRFPPFPPDWMRFKDKCFMFKGKKNDIKANWTYARDWCREQGGDLAVIDDQYENDWLQIILQKIPLWLGAHQMSLKSLTKMQ
uniref:C-type lectin domain-containing protein n=1 Tax=Mola mola TaxID=94237 RepID=A0A3Q3VNW4_MOLML